MSKRLITGLIILMSISLLGIIAVQILWIRNAISIEEKTFASNINKALHKIVFNLENKENVLLLSAGLHDEVFEKSENSEIREFKHFIERGKGHDIVKIKTQQTITGKSINRVDTDSQVIIMNTNGKAFNFWHPKHEKDSSINIDIHVETQDTIIRAIRKEKQIENLFDKVIFEYKTKDVSIKDRIKMDKLPDLIHTELKNYNIDSDFNFAIFSGDSLQLVHSSDSSYTEDLKKSDFQMQLFPNDIFVTHHILSLGFVNRFNLIYKSILPLLILSGIFTLFIIVAFFNAVLLILKQKRISDIKSDFINNITHEFKTPIATIGLASDSINNPKVIGDPDRIRYFTGIIKDENFRMNKQVENILQLSLFGKHELKLNLQSAHLNEIIQKAAEHIQLQIDEKEGLISTNLMAVNDVTNVDEVHFLNVLFNLFDNAIKYSKDKPEISISTENKEQLIVLTVQDSGIGMNSKTIKRIFKKFYRAETGNIHSVKGFGLGLSYVKLVIDRHNGSIDVSSKPGVGTSIQISLPLSKI
ncbi:sensor histidine kinase [Marinifilum caeruleilacunae]|uniref:histidine kinase n=1 Tax=Marinifilum caeruleilacunae TaxID=2499076 RepID=A0ABX1WZS8_9BACT|nr:HAMP domain-containing sensor histidine kinase [Marinifilum caeruleilacunae]NOU61630.1 HAMP domain-containing histidine kinase [Marinifilum caeruleilacunae]